MLPIPSRYQKTKSIKTKNNKRDNIKSLTLVYFLLDNYIQLTLY